MGKLTTHVLDTAQGCPAAGVPLQLWRYDRESGDRQLLAKAVTNLDGRTDVPLLINEQLKVGFYEIIFFVKDYFDRQPLNLPDLPFLTEVPVRFTISDPDANYHIPLLVSPWSYTTYRGS
ncbi:hydroxyisourate hydrolase [Alkalinema pantanalense CENA528]|uniref:hydroxyisourate hydrolase n=1 Tax=Alkalinema pantanalense TaxID=1620705 RepID=UPI003D6FE773